MKSIRLAVICATVIIFSMMSGCNSKKSDNQMDTNPAEAAETPGDEKRKNSQTNEEAAKNVSVSNDRQKDTDFARKAAEAGLLEVKLGRLASEQAASSRVKQFGAMMVKDHSKANKELMSIAEKKGISLSDESSCSECDTKYNELSALKGTAFDKKYVEMMMEGHKEVAEKFSNEASRGEDADLKAFAAKTLPTIKHHLSMLESMQNSITSK